MEEAEAAEQQAFEPEPDVGSAPRSLFGDVETLIDDGRVALAAEFNFHKSRLALSGKAGVRLAALAVGAVLLAFFVLIALTIGLLLALAPLVTIWGATAIVAGSYLLGMAGCLWLALAHWRQIRSAFAEQGK